MNKFYVSSQPFLFLLRLKNSVVKLPSKAAMARINYVVLGDTSSDKNCGTHKNERPNGEY